MSRMLPVALVSLVTLLACSTPEPAAPPTPPTPPTPPAPVEVAAPAAEVLVPSPVQIQAALTEAGITANVDQLVKKGAIQAVAESKDETAFRTGVILAHLVLTAKTAPQADTLARLAAAKEGFVALGAGSDIPKTIDELTTGLKNDAINSDDLVAELDQLSRTMVGEVSYEAGERSIPLIQAGGWLAGTHVVAGAIDASGKADAAGKLLKHPDVVKHFLGYAAAETGTVPPAVMVKVEIALKKLEEISAKDVVTAEDVKAVYSTTGDVLSTL